MARNGCEDPERADDRHAEDEIGGIKGSDHIEVPGQSQELGSDNGNKKVEDLIEPGMTIAWTGLDGKPQGTVKYVADYGQPYTEDQKSGHFFPLMFKPEYYGKDVIVGSQNGEGGKTIKPTAEDPYLIIRVENVTVDKKISAIVSETREKVFELDFTDTTLQENPMAAVAAAIARGTVSDGFIADGKYTASDLQQLTVADIKRIASERGYTIAATKKDAIIAEFLEQQESDAG